MTDQPTSRTALLTAQTCSFIILAEMMARATSGQAVPQFLLLLGAARRPSPDWNPNATQAFELDQRRRVMGFALEVVCKRPKVCR